MSDTAPTMGQIEKVRYTHTDIIDFIIANPGVSQAAIARRYGYTQAWISNIMASDAWQAAMAKRREEIVDPELKATVEERFRGLAILSVKRLMDKLEKPEVSDAVALRAAELGGKACGIGMLKTPAPEGGTTINIFGAAQLAQYAQSRLSPAADPLPLSDFTKECPDAQA